jgi:hypothetical protein
MRCHLVVCGTVNQRGQQRESEIYDCVDRERVAYLISWKRLKSVAGAAFPAL